MPAIVSTKLKFKGEKVKKKKRTHHERDEGDELAALAAGDPRGWVFPEDIMEISGPSFILLPSDPLTCLAWDPQRQKVYAAPIDLPDAPEGAADLTSAEILAAVEPTDVNHVWVISRLSGSEGVISLRSSTGTFLTATPSGTLTANTPSRGPLEAFIPSLNSTHTFPSLSLQTHNEKYISVSSASGLGKKPELRGDADTPEDAQLHIKCQREFVLKAKVAAAEAKGEGRSSKRLLSTGPAPGSVEDEMRKNRDYQAWGGGRHVVSDRDRKDLKKAREEGRLAEAMLDRRAAMKSDRYAK
ncbi:protein FRG1 [Tremella mesenterica]|uniref:Protein FRG1 n=1 Tax=Tremella mesenterica TaxID=5217 RepID=A0A4V1M3E7_TREME|nr:protein FRG1 [Tremella mesenterica]